MIKYPVEEYMVYGDSVINSTGTGTLGRVGYYDIEEDKVVPDSHVTTIRSSKELEKQYVFLYLKSMQTYLEKSGEGSTNQKELKPDTIKQVTISVPPIEEQRRIIKKVLAVYESLSAIENSLI